MIDIKDEMMLDFSINSPRIMITDKIILIDNIEHLVNFSDKTLITRNGKDNYSVITGENILISSLQNSRIVCSGKIKSVEFHKNKNGLE